MKKIILSSTVIFMLSLTTLAASNPSITINPFIGKDDGKNKEISIGTNRATGEMQVRFTTEQVGKASITVLNASGDIVLQQTNEVTNSSNSIPLKNATQLKEGSYTVRLALNNETYHTRFMIWE